MQLHRKQHGCSMHRECEAVAAKVCHRSPGVLDAQMAQVHLTGVDLLAALINYILIAAQV